MLSYWVIRVLIIELFIIGLNEDIPIPIGTQNPMYMPRTAWYRIENHDLV